MRGVACTGWDRVACNSLRGALGWSLKDSGTHSISTGIEENMVRVFSVGGSFEVWGAEFDGILD